MLYIIFALLLLLLIGLSVILINSTGKLPPLKDSAGEPIPDAISEKVWIEVNGIQQGMFIRGENPQNPVLLYLHGGPGTPMLQFISYLEKLKNPEPLEKYFTVCYWDQRGSGMSYSKAIDTATMTIDTMVEDTRVVTKYLKSRFNQDKVYLLGHSWGSYLGVKTIEKHPNDYFAYIGVGQVSNQIASERLAYQYMYEHATKTDDYEVLEKLEKFDPNTSSFPWMLEKGHQLDYLMMRTSIFNKYGIGHLHQGLPKGLSFNGMVFRALLGFKGYTLIEKIKWFLGADFSMIHLFPVVLNDSLFDSSTIFDVPFYIAHGAYDYQVSQKLSQKYLDTIDAPEKEFILFDQSAHSPNLEETEKFAAFMRKIHAQNRKSEKRIIT